MGETRKLAAILVADVVGYSRLAGADEERTLARLRALRSDLIDPTIAVQTGLVERNAGVPDDRRIEFRVGIHVGDVVEEDDGDLMGDGVNVAARPSMRCSMPISSSLP
jgi:adenylate cyclase